MKRMFKNIFKKLGLLEIVRSLYNSVKSFSLSVLFNEIKYRNKGLPDGFPSPPPKLIFLIIGLKWSTIYYYSGKEIFEDMQRFLKKNHINISSFRNVLDFGCGCGMIIRHFHNQYKTVNLFGCDYNTELVEWCSNNLTFGKFDINHLSPPLKYGSDFFDFVYARSVFTHLGIEL